jgi:hypothetical protein
MPNDHANMTDRELALWMLAKMRDSEEFLGVLAKARAAGRPDILDTPDYADKHKTRLKKLYQDDTEGTVTVTAGAAALIEHLQKRDGLSSPEELIEKALAAYLASHEKGSEGLPAQWQSTFALAEAEIEGRVSGAFGTGFVAELASMARQEMEKQAGAERERSQPNERS